jgi:hypothetical protein
MAAKYINPYTDFGFKKIFGEEASKPLLTDELNFKVYRDLKGVIDTAFDEGKIEIARALKQKGMDPKDISDITGLSENELSKL